MQLHSGNVFPPASTQLVFFRGRAPRFVLFCSWAVIGSCARVFLIAAGRDRGSWHVHGLCAGVGCTKIHDVARYRVAGVSVQVSVRCLLEVRCDYNSSPVVI